MKFWCVFTVLLFLIVACCYKFRVQTVAVPVFINLNDSRYIVLKQDTMAMAEGCGLPIKKIYYVEKLNVHRRSRTR